MRDNLEKAAIALRELRIECNELEKETYNKVTGHEMGIAYMAGKLQDAQEALSDAQRELDRMGIK